MRKIVLLLLLLNVLCTSGSLTNPQLENNKQSAQMTKIKYIPKEFHDVELGYYNTNKNPCTPIFQDEMRTVNSITINTPQKIVFEGNHILTIPVCAIFSISQKRGLKYSNLSAKILHLIKNGEETIYSGEIVDKDESPIVLPPNYYEQEKKRQERIKEAQKFTDDELEQQGLAVINYLNVNLLEYIDISLQSGIYEIYMTFYGLESNHTFVDIEFKD